MGKKILKGTVIVGVVALAVAVAVACPALLAKAAAAGWLLTDSMVEFIDEFGELPTWG